MRESGPVFSAPSDGHRVERARDGRVLFSYDVDGRTRVAMFAADGVASAPALLGGAPRGDRSDPLRQRGADGRGPGAMAAETLLGDQSG
jgi:hypothetical protein